MADVALSKDMLMVITLAKKSFKPLAASTVVAPVSAPTALQYGLARSAAVGGTELFD